jgi:hypothetical protein
LIGNIAIGGIIWGIINIVWGIIAMQDAIINAGVALLGLMILGVGIEAMRNPTLGILLAETVVTAILFAWNLGITALNYLTIGTFDPVGLIFPVIIAVFFFNSYRKLQPMKELIASIQPDEIKATKRICKTLVKKKLKNEPSIVQTHNGRCRAQLMDDKAFFIQRDLMRAFVVPKDEVKKLIVKPDAKSLKIDINHPLGKLSYRFDKKNSEKLRSWLSRNAEPSNDRSETDPELESAYVSSRDAQ